MSIDTLVSDIYKLFDTAQEVPEDKLKALGEEIAGHVGSALKREDEGPPKLRMSNIGTPCKRKLWYSIRAPQTQEKLPGHTKIKFLFGHILESLLLFFSELAGHTVTGKQDELDIAGVKGHRDAVIDGRTVDAKSATTHSFKKFKEHRLLEDDPFGYVDQINSYRFADADNVDDKVSFLAIDKQLGHICLDTYEANEIDYEAKMLELQEMLDQDTPPDRAFTDQDHGASGNKCLSMNCSYCPFKQTCWPNLRTFVYSNGPVYMTRVEREPNVPEVKDGGVF